MKIEVKEHSKDPDIVEVDKYDSLEVLKILTEKDDYGNRKNEFIVFGSNIYSTISIQSVRLLEEVSDAEA